MTELYHLSGCYFVTYKLELSLPGPSPKNESGITSNFAHANQIETASDHLFLSCPLVTVVKSTKRCKISLLIDILYIYMKQKITLAMIIVLLFANSSFAGSKEERLNNCRHTIKAFKKTSSMAEVILWEISWYDGNRHEETHSFKELNEFEKFFVDQNFPKSTRITIYGIWKKESNSDRIDDDINNNILSFIRSNGYEESMFALIKRKYPNGIYNCYRFPRDNTIHWNGSLIVNNRIKTIERRRANFEEFKQYFNPATVNINAELIVGYDGPAEQIEKEMYQYLKGQGFKSVLLDEYSDPDP
nr:hypothetical protein [uncultured Desulfobulbus sp.]